MAGPRTARRVWIDTDPAAGVAGCDVDDGYAILQALRSPELDVAGVTTVFGNAPLEVAHPIAAELLQVAGAGHIPLHRGAAGPGELGTPTAASGALAAALAAGPLTILALGPLTNVATALLTQPEIAARIDSVVAVAGRRPGQRFLVGERGPLPDFNLECDPRAAGVLLAAAGVPVILAGFEVATHVLIGPAHLDRLRAGPPAARWLAERSDGWLAWWSAQLGTEGFHPFDTLAVGVLAAPGLIVTEPAQAAVVPVPAAGPGWRGRPGPAFELHAAPSLPGGRPAMYARAARPGFASDLMTRLLRP